MRHESIVIVGGGVAGPVLAALLARRGHPTMLVERRRTGETKCCGCCLAPRGVRLLHSLGMEAALQRADGAWTRRWTMRDPHGEVLLSQCLGAEPGMVVARDRFDQALRELARNSGARLVEGSGAVVARDGEVLLRSGAGEVVDRVRASWIIGADGVGSGVARSAGLGPTPRAETAGAAKRMRRLGFSWSLPEQVAAAIAVAPETIDIHLVQGGYLGLVQGARHLHAAALAPSGRPMSMIRQWGRRSGRLAPLSSGEEREAMASAHSTNMHATGPLPWRPRATVGAIAGVPVALVGDAAGYEQPFTGEGMTWALDSARLLARAIDLERDLHGALQRYDLDHRRHFAWRKRRLRALAAIGLWASESQGWRRSIRLAGRVPMLTGSLVRSVVAA
ncbi:MAG: NAD(P)/FAD-dependent oxidoreductase [Phycisphaeraceae bacterium]|nr:NAD(P)/FAD-dependent oxidoreductase [Phycisphaeraceae bacterium]